MSHGLTSTDSMMSVREVPWHGLGAVLPERPESLPAAEDVKKVERRLASEEKKSLKNPDALPPEE